MTLQRVASGDLVRCQISGVRFFALVTGAAKDRELPVKPLPGAGGYHPTVRHVTARQVIGHWRQRKGSVV